MSDSIRTAVIYYSATGTTYRLAEAVAEGARDAGADVRLLKVHELAPEEAIASNEGWNQHRLQAQDVPEATLDDLDWADAVILGGPTRYGLPAAQIKQFIDTTGPLWGQGKLAGKVYSSFTSAATPHGGQESTLLALNNVFYHWGGIVVPPGYVAQGEAQIGNPYGTSHTSNNGTTPPGDAQLAAARFQGRRTTEIATAIRQGSRTLLGAGA